MAVPSTVVYDTFTAPDFPPSRTTVKLTFGADFTIAMELTENFTVPAVGFVDDDELRDDDDEDEEVDVDDDDGGGGTSLLGGGGCAGSCGIGSPLISARRRYINTAASPRVMANGSGGNAKQKCGKQKRFERPGRE